MSAFRLPTKDFYQRSFNGGVIFAVNVSYNCQNQFTLRDTNGLTRIDSVDKRFETSQARRII